MMGLRQALKEATRRWGKMAMVRRYPAQSATRCTVGRNVLGLAFGVEGQGPTFEAAFRDVDTKAERASVWHAAMLQPCPDCSRTMTDRMLRLDLMGRSERARTRKLLAQFKRRPTGPERQKLAAELYQLQHPHRPVVVERAGAFVAICATCQQTTKEEKR